MSGPVGRWLAGPIFNLSTRGSKGRNITTLLPRLHKRCTIDSSVLLPVGFYGCTIGRLDTDSMDCLVFPETTDYTDLILKTLPLLIQPPELH